MSAERLEVISPIDVSSKLPHALDKPSGGFLYNGSKWLPPKEFQLRPDELLETPVDQRGIIDIDALLTMVESTVVPEYSWPKHPSVHHFYWPETAYPYRPGKHQFSPATFRNLPIHKAKLPRMFENWLHEVTIPAPVPSEEVMQYHVEAWKVAVNLFSSARQVIQWERKARRRLQTVNNNPELLEFKPEGDIYAQEYVADIINRHFSGIEQHMDHLERIPPEFRIIEPAATPQELATSLGRLVIPKSRQLLNSLNKAA